MPDDVDGYIEIELDENDDAGTAEVLDVSFDEPSGPPAAAPPTPPRPPRPAGARSSSVPPPAESALPMTSSGVCPRCGYALRPLEETCPRCHSSVAAPVEKPVENSGATPEGFVEPAVPAPERPVSPQRGTCLFGIAGAILFLVVAVGIPLYIWMQPAQRASREYRAGLAAQVNGEFESARRHYAAALQLNPQFGLAAFSMGTTYLRLGDPAVVQSMESIMERAVQGETGDLDEADKWFERALTIGQDLPPATRLMDARINTPSRLRAFSRALLALTALIRASAALQADQLDDGMAWLQVAGQQAQLAAGDDPGNETANQVLRSAGALGGTPISP